MTGQDRVGRVFEGPGFCGVHRIRFILGSESIGIFSGAGSVRRGKGLPLPVTSCDRQGAQYRTFTPNDL